MEVICLNEITLRRLVVIYVLNILTICNALFRIYGFCMTLALNSDYFLKQH
jgi:hypothetical protein